MPIKIFISYSSRDDDKVAILRDLLLASELEVHPIIVAVRTSPEASLAEKVRTGILESTHFAPIVTRRSIGTQWLNQEIGFAEAHGKIPLALVEKSIFGVLNGFIHSQNDLPFAFSGHRYRRRVENQNFAASCRKVVEYLDAVEADEFSATITPTQVRKGDTYATTVNFRGKVQHGFLDNYIVHLETGEYVWHVDPKTFVREPGKKNNVVPGQLNGVQNMEGHTYSHDTAMLREGRHKVHVRLYEHLQPGSPGRQVVKQAIQYLEVLPESEGS